MRYWPRTRKAERINGINDCKRTSVDKVEQMAGGKGHVIIEHLLGEKELDGKCGLYAKGNHRDRTATLGFHEHHGETETYYILSGEARITTVRSPIRSRPAT